jgi:precorrin-6B methylase 2
LRVVDLGAGTGAMSLGIAAFVDRPVAVTAVDRDRAALELLAETAARLGTITVAPVVTDLGVAALDPGAFDLAVAGSVLNELPEEVAWLALQQMVSAIRADGAVIAIEPALRETARRLHRLRDRAITAGLAHVFAPCTRGMAPCTALAEPDDWCHEDRRVELPSRAREISRATGLRDAGLKFAYLVLRRTPAALVEVTAGRRALRVVSHLMESKGKQECFGCGEQGRVHVRRLRRNRSEANREFERARRGDVLILDPGASAEVAATTPVARIRPAGAPGRGSR